MSTCLSCTQDEFDIPSLTPEQQALIGTAVNFDASMAEDFMTRTSWNHTGAFNDGDLMVIYRQYWDKAANDGQGAWTEDTYRSYTFDVKYATGTTVSLGRNWKVAPQRKGANWDNDQKKIGTPFNQTIADSLTWENGSTVRFRAWSRSNLANYLNDGRAEYYYPDYCIANWATVSGPTQGIPLTLRHACSRIGFTCKAGNQFAGGEICLAKEDYMWEDNADTNENDTNDKLDEESAITICTAVNEVFNRMCMPAGVNIDDGTLYAMTNTLYDNLKSNKGFATLEQKTTSDGLVAYNSLSPEDIKTTVKHPQFNHNDGRLYMFAIPYDMSTADTRGEELVLPALTRFKIRLRDVNNGDAGNTSGYEYKEHIFSLNDIRNTDGSPKYPDGLILGAGKSYLFSVGYLYDQLKVDIIEEGMQWSTSPLYDIDLQDSKTANDEEHVPYKWFTDAINIAIGESKVAGQDYNPIFELSTPEDFVEFVNLVNGNFPQTGIKRVQRTVVNPEYDKTKDPEYKAENDPVNYGSITDKNELQRRKKNYGGYYWWYDEEATLASIAAGNDTVWISKEDAANRGYVIFNHYYPQISTSAAHSEEQLLDKAYRFYDEQLPLHFVVQLKNDIDLGDWQLETIGRRSENPFMGYFSGNMHKLQNVNMKDQHLFGYMTDGEIRNLVIESYHNTALLKEGTVSDYQNLRIAGVSLRANCTTNPIAEKLLMDPAGTKTGKIYVVGCIQYGDAGGALVGESDNLVMMACMRTASNTAGGALLGKYNASSTSDFFKPQTSVSSLSWTSPRFMCNYYIKTPSLGTRAVGFLKDGTTTPAYKDKNNKVITYLPQQYIRGAHDYVLKAKLDNLLADDVSFNQLTSDLMKEEFYGIAPWKAMNYAIAKYNALSVATNHEYKLHNQDHKINAMYSISDIGYKNLFPQLVGGAPDITDAKDPLKQNN